jgi:hypothetical protein
MLPVCPVAGNQILLAVHLQSVSCNFPGDVCELWETIYWIDWATSGVCSVRHALAKQNHYWTSSGMTSAFRSVSRRSVSAEHNRDTRLEAWLACLFWVRISTGRCSKQVSVTLRTWISQSSPLECCLHRKSNQIVFFTCAKYNRCRP